MSRPVRPAAAGQSSHFIAEILRLPETGTADYLLLDQPVTILTHWLQGASRACPGVDACPASAHSKDAIRKGYLPAMIWVPLPRGVWVPGVFEATEVLLEAWQGREMRGEVWRLFRQRTHKKGYRAAGEPVDSWDAQDVPASFDVKPIVKRFYRATAIAWNVDAVYEPPTVLPSVKGKAPPGQRGQGVEETPATAEEIAALRQRMHEDRMKNEPEYRKRFAAKEGGAK